MTQVTADPVTEAAQMGARMLAGTELFGRIRDKDVEIGATPKELVWRQDKVSLWLRMEKWIADRPDHPGEAAKRWIKDLYQQNKLVKNELVLDGRRVDLGQLTMPVLNVYAKDDHIIPPATTRALAPLLPEGQDEELALPGGHVGVFVGEKSQKLFAPAIAQFIGRHDQAG